MSEQLDFSSLVDENTKLKGQIRRDYEYLKLLVDTHGVVGEAVDMVGNYRRYMRRDHPWLEEE